MREMDDIDERDDCGNFDAMEYGGFDDLECSRPPPEPQLDPVGVAIVCAIATLALAAAVGGCLYLAS